MNGLRLGGLRGQKLPVASVIFFIDQRFVERRVPVPVGENLQRPTLISHPTNPAAFPIERKVSFISCNLLFSLGLSIDFNVYLWTEQRGGRWKQTKRNICCDWWQGLCERIKVYIRSNASVSSWNTNQYHFLFVFPSLSVMNEHDKTSASVI